MKTLAEMIGEEFVLQTVHQLLNEEHPVIVTKLMAVDEGGIWVEGRGLAKFMAETFKQTVPKMPVFFVPYAQIVWILNNADYPHLYEKGLGLQ